MANETIKIKCPECASVLTIKYQPGIESKKLRCPVCKIQNPYTYFSEVKDIPPLPGDDSNDTIVTSRQNAGSNQVGWLRNMSNGEIYRLREGRNVIGRRAMSSQADIQIPVMPNDKNMSRMHMVISVTNIPGIGIRHIASLYKEMVNRTTVGGHPIGTVTDKAMLTNGAIIDLAGTILRFETGQPGDSTNIY